MLAGIASVTRLFLESDDNFGFVDLGVTITLAILG